MYMYNVSAMAGVLGLISGNYISPHNIEMFLNSIAT